jgi:hypothetical protein
LDAQPSPAPQGSGILVFVSGQLSCDGANPLRFSQAFNLQPIPNQAGGYYVLNDLFRLCYG